MYDVTWKFKFLYVFIIGTTSAASSCEDSEEQPSKDSTKKKSMWNLM